MSTRVRGGCVQWAQLGACALLATQFVGGAAMAAPVVWSENGHFYELVLGSINWNQAKVAAAARTHIGWPGHLVTVTSADENLFLTATFGGGPLDGKWLGGVQPPGSPEPAGGWTWITGESFSFQGWFPGGEPNNTGGNESVIQFAHSLQAWGKGWNDAVATSNGSGYVVEYEQPPAWQNLHPFGEVGYSYAIWFYAGSQVGNANNGINNYASLWTGAAASWVSLNPTGAASSVATGVYGGKQVGTASIGGQNHAGIWSGTATSWVDLNPAGAVSSEARGIYGNQQVGFAFLDAATPHASLWTGTPASWADLHPAGGWEQSYAYGIYETHQVGVAVSANQGHASLWNGNAASWVDLNPAGATTSVATSMYKNYQGGRATTNGVRRAGVWRGTPESWVSIGPDSATDSGVAGVFADYQVGFAWIADAPRASLWRGTKASWTDLTLLLPNSWVATEASAVWADESNLYITGNGVRVGEGGTGPFALLWILRKCPSDFNLDGVVEDSDFVSFASDYNVLVCDDEAMAVGCPSDLNSDGFVDDVDFVLFADAYDGLMCP